MSRDFGYYWLRLLIYILVTVCIGTIYLNVGTSYSAILVLLISFTGEQLTLRIVLILPLSVCEFRHGAHVRLSSLAL